MSKNKIEQTQRREIRSFVNSQYKIINSVLKKRPKWLPIKLWSFGAKIFIDVEKLKSHIKNFNRKE